MCLCARKTKRYGQRVPIVSYYVGSLAASGSNFDFVGVSVLMLLLTLRETYALKRLSSFRNLRRKGGKFDHRPGRPKVLLRHWFSAFCVRSEHLGPNFVQRLVNDDNGFSADCATVVRRFFLRTRSVSSIRCSELLFWSVFASVESPSQICFRVIQICWSFLSFGAFALL